MQKKKLHFTTYLICQRKTSKKNIKRPLDHIHVNSCNWQDPVGIQKTEHLVNIALSLMTIKLTGRNINRVMGVEWTNKEHLLNIAWLFLYICRGSLCLDNNLSIVISCRVYLHTFFCLWTNRNSFGDYNSKLPFYLFVLILQIKNNLSVSHIHDCYFLLSLYLHFRNF